jgi:hypothetical protein
MRLSRQDSVIHCDACERTLLLGEEAFVFRDGDTRMTVCALCEAEAIDRGWLRDGDPPPPPQVRSHRPGLRDRLRDRRHRQEPPPPPPLTAAAPSSVVRLTQTEEPYQQRARARHEARAEAAAQAVADGVAAFNQSAYQRTVHGIAKSLGHPRVSILPLQGTRPDVIVTVAWDLSWYQYRVDPQRDPAVRLQGRGDDLAELDQRWCAWNGSLTDAGQVALR